MTDAGYDNKVIAGFTNAMYTLFQSNKEGHIDQGIAELNNWLKDNKGSVFENSFDYFGKEVLSEKEYAHALTLSKAEQGNIMQEKFINKMSENANSEIFLSYKASQDSIGRNSRSATIQRTMDRAKAANANPDGSLKAATSFAIGNYDEKALTASIQHDNRIIAEKARREAAAYIQNKNNSISNVTENAARQVLSEASDELASFISKGPTISGIGGMMVGMAAGLMISGYASGNPLKDKPAQQMKEEQQVQAPQNTMTVPQFMDQGGFVTGNTQQGYVINLTADTKKGRKYMQSMLSKAAEASVGGAVSVNMNIRDIKQNGITDRDIENFIQRHL